MMSAIITLCLVIFTFQSLGSSDHSNLIDSSNKLNATALDGNSRPSTTTDEKNCTHETDPYSSDHSSRPPFQDNFIRSFTSAPLLPVGECGEALQLSKLKFRATGIARQCLNRGRCRLSKEGRLQSLKSEIRKLVGLSLSNWNNHDDIESDSEVILSRKYSGEDWKYLRNWDEMEKSSVFFGHPTLRFRLKSVFKTSAVSLQSMPPTASPSKYSDASRISNDLSGALHNINDLNPAFTVDLVGTSSSRSSDQTCPVIHASGNSRGVRMDRVLVNELNVCAPRSDTFASHLSDLIGSGFQDAKKSASRCLLPLSTDTDLTPFPDLRMSLPLSGDERLVTFLEPLGHGAEAEVWRVCISGSRAGVKDTSAQFAALKVYRRQFRYPRHPRSSSLGEERGQKIDPIPPFNETWDKAVGSLNEAVGSARLLPQSVALLPLSIWDVGSKGFFHVTTERYSAISRYSVYLGYAAAFDIADEVGSPYCSQHISDFMIFQDLESFTLRQAGGTVAIEEIKVIGRSLVQSLAVTENLGYVWLDLKPQNVLLVSGAPKIGDVGYLRPIGEEMKMPGIGTAGFRPFESLVSKLRLPLYQSRAVFALGVTLYSMAFGKLPWKEKEIETMAKDATKLRQWKLESVRGLSNSFKSLLEGLLDPNPTHRMTLNQAMRHPFFSN